MLYSNKNYYYSQDKVTLYIKTFSFNNINANVEIKQFNKQTISSQICSFIYSPSYSSESEYYSNSYSFNYINAASSKF